MTGANIGHRNFEIPLDIATLKILGPCEEYPDVWNLEAERRIPMILVADNAAADGRRSVWIYAPQFRSMSVPNPKVVVTIDTVIAKMRIPARDIPTDDAARYLLDTMAAAQRDDEVYTINGTPAALRALLQDAADLTGHNIDVKCAENGLESPSTYVNKDATTYFTQRSSEQIATAISAMVRYFKPVGCQGAGLGSWMERRYAIDFALIQPRTITGHDRIEAATRLKGFYETHAPAMGIGPRALANRLKALGLGAQGK